MKFEKTANVVNLNSFGQKDQMIDNGRYKKKASNFNQNQF
jgi:hypothetical protein